MTEQSSPRWHRSLSFVAGLSGFAVVALNIAAVAFLRTSPHVYKPSSLDKWFEELTRHPQAHGWSALCFTLGTLALIPFALGVWRALWSKPKTRSLLGPLALGLGGLLNAVSTMTVFVVARYLLPHLSGNHDSIRATSMALLGMTLSMDSLFNLVFGLGLMLVGWAQFDSERFWRWQGLLGLVAGALTVVVSLQLFSDTFARLLGIAGPLWLLWVLSVSWSLFGDTEAEA